MTKEVYIYIYREREREREKKGKELLFSDESQIKSDDGLR